MTDGPRELQIDSLIDDVKKDFFYRKAPHVIKNKPSIFRRGELFGIRNLFRVNPAGHSLTLDIEQRNRKMEERVRGRGLEGLCSIRANMLRDAEADEVVATDPEDPFMLGLDEELGEDHEPLSIRQVSHLSK